MFIFNPFGATSGIGRELTTVFARVNYTIGITGRRIQLLEELKLEWLELSKFWFSLASIYTL